MGVPSLSFDKARAALATLADRQHAAARLTAEGAPLREVAAALGVTMERAAGLVSRPAFRELVAFYRPAR